MQMPHATRYSYTIVEESEPGRACSPPTTTSRFDGTALTPTAITRTLSPHELVTEQQHLVPASRSRVSPLPAHLRRTRWVAHPQPLSPSLVTNPSTDRPSSSSQYALMAAAPAPADAKAEAAKMDLLEDDDGFEEFEIDQEGSVASRIHCQESDTSLPGLPEEIWCQIHSLLPMRDAARVACVSRSFEHSWRYYPNLVFSEETLGINVNTCRKDEKMRDFTSKVDSILKRHSHIGVKTFEFKVGAVHSAKDCCHLDHLDNWLHSAVKPGIEKINLKLSSRHPAYSFPYSLLSSGTGDSLQYLILVSCHFHPTELVCLKSLTRLDLNNVYILDDELECLLSNSFCLEQLKVACCNDIACLKIPCLQHLSSLEVCTCSLLQKIESKAPNLSSFSFRGDLQVLLSLGGTQKIKNLTISFNDATFYACTELPSSMPNLEALRICSLKKTISTPMVNTKFLHLKFLDIMLGGRGCDFLSLVSFFDSSPSLETFILNVLLPVHGHNISIFVDPLDLRTVPGHLHDKLKRVEIINFSSAKSLIELTFHILQSARSLERLTLDTTRGYRGCSVNKSGKCISMPKDALSEAHRALLAVQTYIKPNVPPTVELNAVEPCNRCHDVV